MFIHKLKAYDDTNLCTNDVACLSVRSISWTVGLLDQFACTVEQSIFWYAVCDTNSTGLKTSWKTSNSCLANRKPPLEPTDTSKCRSYHPPTRFNVRYIPMVTPRLRFPFSSSIPTFLLRLSSVSAAKRIHVASISFLGPVARIWFAENNLWGRSIWPLLKLLLHSPNN